MSGVVVADLIEMVASRAGITKDQAKMAVTEVLSYIKKKYPLVSRQVDGILGQIDSI